MYTLQNHPFTHIFIHIFPLGNVRSGKLLLIYSLSPVMKNYILEEATLLRVIYENLISQECIFKIDEFGGVKCKISFKFIVTLRHQLFG